MASFINAVRTGARVASVSGMAVAVVMASTGSAGAVSLGVQLACATDYYAHCSAYSPTSPQVRSCMRAVGNSLSKRCVDALVAAGEVSAAEVASRRAHAETAAR